MTQLTSRKQLFLTLLVASLIVLAGCGTGGDGTGPQADEPDSNSTEYPAVVEATADSLPAETSEAFLDALTDENGELTADGEAFVERLERVAAIGEEHRDAVGRSIATGELTEKRLAQLDAVLASANTTRKTILRHGLEDSSGDGLFDGETALLELNEGETYPTVATAASQLRTAGYNNSDVRYLEQIASYSTDSFAMAQIRGLELVGVAVANGSITAADRQQLNDSSGDGLLDGTSEALSLDPTEQQQTLASLAEPLASGGYEAVETDYLHQVADISDNPVAWEQAVYLGLLSETVRDESVTNDTVVALDRRGSSLLAGFADELGLHAGTDNSTVERLAVNLSVSGYDEQDVRFLAQAANVTESSVSYEQARALSLFENPVQNGSATDADRTALRDSSGDGLLDPMAVRVGVDPLEVHPTLGEFTTALANGGYEQPDIAYLGRIKELTAYRDNKYEQWEQAAQMGLLDDAVANGTITEHQLWQLQNADSDRLLNGMEIQFGTSPEREDSSGDGYLDHLAWGPMRDLGFAVNPGETDIYIELDTAAGQSFPDETQIDQLKQTVTVEPSSKIGPINLHFRECDTGRDGITRTADLTTRVDEYRSITGVGFHYLLINDGSIELEGDDAAGVTYLSERRTSWMAVDGTVSDQATREHGTSVIAHELGHSLGILDDQFDGVDSRKYPSWEYNSVMNYNHWTPVTFSTEEPFNDYERMADQSFGSFHQDHSALQRLWEDGEITQELGCS